MRINFALPLFRHDSSASSCYPSYNRVSFRMPSGVAAGSAVPVRLTYIGRPSNAVTIGVQ
jgi:hypothetical protein